MGPSFLARPPHAPPTHSSFPHSAPVGAGKTDLEMCWMAPVPFCASIPPAVRTLLGYGSGASWPHTIASSRMTDSSGLTSLILPLMVTASPGRSIEMSRAVLAAKRVPEPTSQLSRRFSQRCCVHRMCSQVCEAAKPKTMTPMVWAMGGELTTPETWVTSGVAGATAQQ